MKPPTFNLVHDPWLVVRLATGELATLSLERVLLEAHTITRLEDASPLVQGGLHRLLLAVLHRALAGPSDLVQARALLHGGRFPAEVIQTYLERYGDRFELFHPDHPFYQVGDFDLPADKLAPVTRLIAEAASGNNATLFDHSVDDRVRPRSAGEVARYLVAHQTFALGGGRSALGYTVHAPVATSALTFALGETLFETLLLNLVPYRPVGDAPVWERPPLTVADLRTPRDPDGLTDRYTWPSRALRLFARAGRDGPVVSHLAYAAGLEGAWTDDPMASYREVKDLGTLPFSFRLERASWRDFRALVPTPGSAYTPPAVIGHAAALGEHRPLQPVMVVGLVSDRAKILSWRTEVFPLPQVLLDNEGTRELLGTLLETADALGRDLAGVQRGVAERLLTTNRTPDRAAVTRLADSLPLTRTYWSRAEVAFEELLDRLAASAEVETWWKSCLHDIALSAWRETVRAAGTTSRALRALQGGERVLLYTLHVHTRVQARKEAA